MDIRTLKYFIAVVENSSISNAAKTLHISQPPLSQQIKLLEEELDVVLLERGSRSVHLTDAGMKLYQRAKNIVDYIGVTKKEIMDLSKGVSGNINIGMVSSCGTILIPEFIKSFSEKYPNVTFNIFEKNTYKLLESLNTNLVELAFVRTPFNSENDSDYEKISLSKEPMVAFGKKDFFLNIKTSSIHIEAFNDMPLILYRRWQRIIQEVFMSNNVSPIYKCINEDARSSLMWAIYGLGVAIVPESISKLIMGENMRSLRVESKLLYSEVCALWKKNRYISPVLTHFINQISNIY